MVEFKTGKDRKGIYMVKNRLPVTGGEEE